MRCGDSKKSRLGAVETQGDGKVFGPSGISGWQFVTEGFSIKTDRATGAQVTCPNGKKALGGGVAGYGGPWYLSRVVQSAPAGQATGWLATVRNDGIATVSYFVWAICAYVTT